MTGQTVSHYRILEKLGEGGMGVVWKAEDTKLKRTVALKFVPSDTTGDAELCTRFRQEAQAAAALSHPNVCTVYEIDEDCGFLAMEFVDGETAQARAHRRPLPLAEALDLAMQAAQGLQAAHEKGVVHRDIKSANLMVTPQNSVKIMDFGLARLTGRTRVTKTGTAMGTPAYMSPEQAMGKTVDRRTDPWSLGVVLYELVTGQLPFRGETEAAVVHSLLHADPEPVTALRAGLPLELDRVIGKALAKDPGERYQHAEDLLVDLRTLRGRLQLESKAERLATVAAKRRGMLAAALAGLMMGAAGMGAWFWNRARTAPSPVTRFSVTLAPGEIVSPLGATSVRLSPDGSRLAWVTADIRGVTRIYYRELESLETRKPEGTIGGSGPFFSPDGRSLGFTHSGSRTVRKLALSGGAATTVCPIETGGGGFWGADGKVLLTASYPGAIMRVPAEGGTPQAVTTLDAKAEERVHGGPVILPGGKAFLYNIGAGGMDSYDDARIAVQSFKTGERRILIQGGVKPFYSSTGHIVYGRAGKLLAVPFDIGRLEVTGDPVPVVDGVFMCTNTGAAHYSLAENGTLAYAPGMVLGGERQLMWVDRQGKAELIPVPPKAYLHPRISPDGKKLAVEIEGVMHDFWAYDIERAIMTKMTTEGSSHWPLWTPDGGHLTYRRWLGGHFSMWWMPTDRSAPPERLTETGRMQSAASWSPRGNVVAFTQVNMDTGPDVYVMDMDGDRKPRPFAQTRFAEGSPKFSSDGRWIAYASNESGRNEIYVQAYPGPGARIQISTEGGTDAAWKPNGGELYYRDGDKMMVVGLNTAGAFQASRPKLLWTGQYTHGMGSLCGAPGTTSSNYDVSKDGQRFLMIKQDEVAPAQINVVLNWTEELKRILQQKRM